MCQACQLSGIYCGKISLLKMFLKPEAVFSFAHISRLPLLRSCYLLRRNIFLHLHRTLSTPSKPKNFTRYELALQEPPLIMPEFFNVSKDVLDKWAHMEKYNIDVNAELEQIEVSTLVQQCRLLRHSVASLWRCLFSVACSLSLARLYPAGCWEGMELLVCGEYVLFKGNMDASRFRAWRDRALLPEYSW
uniref:Uncharacterized protein n=1 Tax=Eptatretus burgeri TaxID=7764 RepID=A0A8C4R0A6_EPTBU